MLRAVLICRAMVLIVPYAMYCDKSMLPNVLKRVSPNPINDVVTVEVVHRYKRAMLHANARADGGVLQTKNGRESVFLLQRSEDKKSYTVVDVITSTNHSKRMEDFASFQKWWKRTGHCSVPTMGNTEYVGEWADCYIVLSENAKKARYIDMHDDISDSVDS